MRIIFFKIKLFSYIGTKNVIGLNDYFLLFPQFKLLIWIQMTFWGGNRLSGTIWGRKNLKIKIINIWIYISIFKLWYILIYLFNI